jgi:sigma-B regulation protein RsbU (phosphoserine phosphatase)
LNPLLRKILKLGVDSSYENKENQLTYTLNSFILLVQLVSIFFSVFSYFIAQNITMSLFILGLTFFMLIPYALNAAKQIATARFSFILICYINLLISSMLFGPEVKFHIFIISVTLTSFILLRLQSKLTQWVVIGFGFACFICSLLYFQFYSSTIVVEADSLKRIGSLSEISFIFTILAIVYIFVYNSDQYERVIQESNKKLHKANMAINDGLTYAKSIQSALLPSKTNFIERYPNSFILQIPKDEVSGDFIWYETEGDFLYILAGDCTGHGIPGSLISIMCSNIVDEVFKSQRNISPGEFLNEIGALLALRIGKNVGVSIKLKDGMDCSLVKFNTRSGSIEYAGARNEIVIIKDKDQIRQKGNRQSIEGNSSWDDYDFTNHKFMLNNGDTFYLFTDGFADQKGGPRNKKYYALPLIDLLINNKTLSAPAQKELLATTFNSWKGRTEQFDDVTVIGFKFEADRS